MTWPTFTWHMSSKGYLLRTSSTLKWQSQHFHKNGQVFSKTLKKFGQKLPRTKQIFKNGFAFPAIKSFSWQEDRGFRDSPLFYIKNFFQGTDCPLRDSLVKTNQKGNVFCSGYNANTGGNTMTWPTFTWHMSSKGYLLRTSSALKMIKSEFSQKWTSVFKNVKKIWAEAPAHKTIFQNWICDSSHKIFLVARR